MALDIEHHTKLQLLRKIDEYDEDSYQIVKDYIDSLDEKYRKYLFNELNRNRGNAYYGDIIEKYDGNYPVWVFLEIILFGRMVAFYCFCANRFSDKEMKNNYYGLLTCKRIRNVAAHSNCILNELRLHTAEHLTNKDIIKELISIPHMNSNFRKNKMSNVRIQQIVTLLYMHKKTVRSEGVALYESRELKKLMRRIDRNPNYYKTNKLVQGTFKFLELVVDSWF